MKKITLTLILLLLSHFIFSISFLEVATFPEDYTNKNIILKNVYIRDMSKHEENLFIVSICEKKSNIYTDYYFRLRTLNFVLNKEQVKKILKLKIPRNCLLNIEGEIKEKYFLSSRVIYWFFYIKKITIICNNETIIL